MKHPEIIYVEDNPNDAELTMIALTESKLNEKVLWLKDGKEAIDYLFPENDSQQNAESPLPKFILLDLNLPKISGLEVLKKIRSTARTKLLPVVVLTSSREDNDVIDSYELGVNSYIVKPVNYEKFTRCIQELGYYWMKSNQTPR